MPNIKSAKKRVRVGARNNTRNVDAKSEYRSAVRAAKEAVEAGDEKLAKEKTNRVHKLLDKAAHNNVIHHNKANRIKSRLAKLAKAKFAK